MRLKTLIFSLGMIFCLGEAAMADNLLDNNEKNDVTEHKEKASKKSRLSIGGYGEAVYSRNYFSDDYRRYLGDKNDPKSSVNKYKNDKHGRFDLPHVVIFLGYDFGNGWTMNSEIEFEHGGTESAIEVEAEEGGEYESEIERGGEVALEQFWIQKSFCPELNVKLGHIIVPIGGTNQHHLPTEFFGVYRPVGENTIMPCTWHETGVSVWGTSGDWRYEALLISGLDSERFGRDTWVHGGSASPYEFKIANTMAGAFRVDNYSVPGLRLSLSGYVGNSFKNTLRRTDSDTYKNVKGTVAIGAFDFHYDAHNWIVRGNFDYGHLDDSDMITQFNKGADGNSPSPKQEVASDAIATGIEAGYNIFSQIDKMNQKKQKLYLFARYDYYDSMYKTDSKVADYKWCGRQRIAAGLNYYPMKDIVLKGEYSIGLMDKKYYNEPAISFGIAYAGFFTK